MDIWSPSLDVGCLLFYSVEMILHCFTNVDVQALNKPRFFHCIFFSIQVCFYCADSIFGVAVKLKKGKLLIRHFSNCMVHGGSISDGFCVHSSIDFDKVPNTTGRNAAPKHDRAVLCSLAYLSLFFLLPFLNNGFLSLFARLGYVMYRHNTHSSLELDTFYMFE